MVTRGSVKGHQGVSQGSGKGHQGVGQGSAEDQLGVIGILSYDHALLFQVFNSSYLLAKFFNFPCDFKKISTVS